MSVVLFPGVRFMSQGCMLTFFVHGTGAEEVDSSIAQAKKPVALFDISKISKNNHK